MSDPGSERAAEGGIGSAGRRGKEQRRRKNPL